MLGDPSLGEKEKEAAAALLKEYERVCVEIRSTELINEKIIAFGLTIITASAFFGEKEHLDIALFFSPLALFGVIYFALVQYQAIFWRGGYKKIIEEKLNTYIGTTVLAWEHVIENRPRINFINISLGIIYAIITIGIIFHSTAKIFQIYDSKIAISFALINVACLLYIPINMIHLRRALKNSYLSSRRAYFGDPLRAKK